MMGKSKNKILIALLCLGLLCSHLPGRADETVPTLPSVGPSVESTTAETEAETDPEPVEVPTTEEIPAESRTEPADDPEEPAAVTMSVDDYLKLKNRSRSTESAIAVTSSRTEQEKIEEKSLEVGILLARRMRRLAEASEMDIVIFRGSGSLNVRKEPTANSERVGRMRYDNTARVLEKVYTENGLWYKIESGSVSGYIKSEYVVDGYEAAEIISEIVTTFATIKNDAQRLYRYQDTYSDTLASLESGKKYQVESRGEYYTRIQYAFGDGGVLYGYVPNSSIELSWELKTAISVEEENRNFSEYYRIIYELTSIDESRSRSVAESIYQSSVEESRRQYLESVEAARRASIEESIRQREAWEASSRAEESQRAYQQWLAQSAANEAAKNRNAAYFASYIPAGTSNFRRAVVLEALKYVGVLEYRWGWESLEEGADCSGFLRAIFLQFGIDIPHYSYWIATTGVKVISIDYARPGDIICYRTWDPSAG